MTEREIDLLVEQIGDELLTRLAADGFTLRAAEEPEPEPPAHWVAPPGGLAGVLDLTALDPALSAAELAERAAAAARAGLRALWTPSARAAAAARLLRGSKTRLGATVGFPHGTAAATGKLAEAETALRNGAVEIEVVASPRAVADQDLDALFAELRPLAVLARAAGARLTATFEPQWASAEALARAAATACFAGAHAVKLCTGVNSHRPPQPETVAALARAAGDGLEIAVGEVRSLGRLAGLLAAGARRASAANALDILQAASS